MKKCLNQVVYNIYINESSWFWRMVTRLEVRRYMRANRLLYRIRQSAFPVEALLMKSGSGRGRNLYFIGIPEEREDVNEDTSDEISIETVLKRIRVSDSLGVIVLLSKEPLNSSVEFIPYSIVFDVIPVRGVAQFRRELGQVTAAALERLEQRF